MKYVSIYALLEPDTDVVRYVGKTTQPLHLRLQQHCSLSRRHRHPRAQWVHALRDQNQRPRIVLLETVLEEEWRTAERQWVERHHSSSLLNDAPAGGGGTRSHLSRWTPDLEARLGKESDAIIAEDMGLTRKAVAYRRTVLGIPASYDKSRMKAPPALGGWNRRSLPDELVAQLGTKPDYILGQEFGFNKSQVARARQSLHILSYAETTGNTGKYKKGNLPQRWQ